MVRGNLPINGQRLWDDIMALAAITDPGAPFTRRSFSELFLTGRDWLSKRFAEAGLAVSLDSGGNLIGRLAGIKPGTIMIGSHSDTVPSGGRFDGIAGVITALEVVRSMRDHGIIANHTIDIVDFLAEEPSEYGLSCIGSRAMSGHLTKSQLDYKHPDGETLAGAIDRIGGRIADLANARRDDIAAFFELHIEQGIVLEQAAIDVGIVTAIAGIARIEIGYQGRADHAGATPMSLRRDAGLAAAKTVLHVNSLATEIAESGNGHFVATTGIVEQMPNAANVIAGQSRLVIDVRAEDHAMTEAFLAKLDDETNTIASACRVNRSKWLLLSDTMPAKCDETLQELLAESAAKLGLKSCSMASGAGHDTAFISHVASSCMVFVPSKEGISHAPDEWTEPEEIAAGAAVLFESVIAFDRR
ncbi:Zn-dependent hydrolase [Bartonella sp. LJL80]